MKERPIRILLKDFDLVATMDSKRQEIPGGYVLIEGNRIIKVGKDASGLVADKVINGSGKVLLPGMVNTHHHLFQTLTRSVPNASENKLFTWISLLYKLWEHLDVEAVRVSATIGCTELLLSGATTTSDLFYIFPKGQERIFDALIEGATRTGIRFYPCRGSYSLSKENGGLPPKSLVQSEREIIKDSIRVIEQYHDPSQFSMLKVALGPCAPFTASPDLFRETAKLADEYKVLLHTHLAETVDEEEFCLSKFGARPVDYMEDLGWLRPDVWFAHLVYITSTDIKKLAKGKVSMSYCPSSNMILGSGIAPVVKLQEAGVNVSFGVDGAASNDTSNMIREVRQGMLLQRVRYGPKAMSARDALYLATMGGARTLHCEDTIGSIEVGKAADLIAFDVSGIEFAGAHSDPLAALVRCAANRVAFSMVNGKILVQDGQILNGEIPRLIAQHNKISQWLVQRA